MSFSAFVPSTDKADLSAAIDAMTAAPPLVTDEAKGYFEAAQAAAKAIGEKFDGGYPIAVNISGHACQDPADSKYDSVAISVYETAPVVAPDPPQQA